MPFGIDENPSCENIQADCNMGYLKLYPKFTFNLKAIYNHVLCNTYKLFIDQYGGALWT